MKGPDGSNYYSIDYSDNGTKIRPHNENAYHPDTIQFWLVEAPRVDAQVPIQKTTTTAKPPQPTPKSLNKNQNNAQVQDVRAQPIIKAEPKVASTSSNWETAFWVALCACIALILVFVVLGTLRFCRAKPASHILADERTALLADQRNGSLFHWNAINFWKQVAPSLQQGYEFRQSEDGNYVTAFWVAVCIGVVLFMVIGVQTTLRFCSKRRNKLYRKYSTLVHNEEPEGNTHPTETSSN